MNTPLDPLPYRCAHAPRGSNSRHGSQFFCTDASFEPRPEYEQDESKYL